MVPNHAAHHILPSIETVHFNPEMCLTLTMQYFSWVETFFEESKNERMKSGWCENGSQVWFDFGSYSYHHAYSLG